MFTDYKTIKLEKIKAEEENYLKMFNSVIAKLEKVCQEECDMNLENLFFCKKDAEEQLSLVNKELESRK